MARKFHQGLAVGLLALALSSLGASVHAQDQDRPNDQTRHEKQTRQDEGHARGDAQHEGHAGHATTADLDRYRRAHPHAAARCTDGFFTNTTDRHRACSKHGGVNVWLRPQ
jgi:hypothetical protein